MGKISIICKQHQIPYDIREKYVIVGGIIYAFEFSCPNCRQDANNLGHSYYPIYAKEKYSAIKDMIFHRQLRSFNLGLYVE